MAIQTKNSLTLIPQFTTTDSWFHQTKSTPQETLDLKAKLTTNKRTSYQEYQVRVKSNNKLKPTIISREHSHSLLARFQAEFQKTVSSTITEGQTKIAKRMSSILPNLKRSSVVYLKQTDTNKTKSNKNLIGHLGNITSKEDNNNNNNKPMGSSVDDNESDNNEDIITHNSHFNSSKDSMTYKSPPTYSEPNSIISKARLRRYDLKYKSNWKDKAGMNIQDIKYNKAVIRDQSFQHNYIKGELKILFDNYYYYKQNFLNKKDILTAFKNKDIRAQIALNKTIEETISFLTKIPALILKDFNQYTDNFIGVDSIPRSDLKKTYITNEANCFVYNIQLLNRLVLFVRCCFEVYLTITKQVNSFVLHFDDFNYLRGVLEKTRFNTNDIISVSRAFLNDLNFEKDLIEKYHPIMINDGNTAQRKRKNLEDLIHQQFQFNKNEQSQKKKRMDNVLTDSEEEDDDRNKNKRRIKVRNGCNIMAKPMKIINSRLMTNMLKYCKKDVREKIISIRAIERYQDMENKNND